MINIPIFLLMFVPKSMYSKEFTKFSKMINVLYDFSEPIFYHNATTHKGYLLLKTTGEFSCSLVVGNRSLTPLL